MHVPHLQSGVVTEIIEIGGNRREGRWPDAAAVPLSLSVKCANFRRDLSDKNRSNRSPDRLTGLAAAFGWSTLFLHGYCRLV